MSNPKDSADAQVLHWSGKLFSSEDLRRNWNNQRELVLSPRALLTPLALDELRAKGVRITREETKASGEVTSTKGWSYAQENAYPQVDAVVASLARDGVRLNQSPERKRACLAPWLRSIAAATVSYDGTVLFCDDSILHCCLVNKLPGLRAAAVANAMQTSRALASLGCNFLIVEMPGRTYFEIRQILKTAATGKTHGCPPEMAKILLEIEGHAHR